MPVHGQHKKTSGASSGEEFSNVSSSADTDDEAAAHTHDNWTFPVVPYRAKREDYETALKSAQIKVGELQDLVKKLQLRNSELRASAKVKKRTKSSRSALSDIDKLISQQAKKFGVMNEIFVPPTALGVKRPPTNSMDPGRYESELAELHGVIAEVYECLPDKFHDDLETSLSFRNLFLRQLNSNRRSIIHQFRSSTASEIFGYPTQYYRIHFKRDDVPAFQSLLKFPTDHDQYPKLPPLLFPNRQQNMKKLFQCVELTKMLKTILFGGTSISSNKQPVPKTQGRVWQVTVVTPGAIAFMAVLAIFLHSPDQEFAAIGAKTRIGYAKRFTMFKKFLIANAHRECIKNLFRWWNGSVFSFEMSETMEREGDGQDSGMEEAEATLNSDEEFSDEAFDRMYAGDCSADLPASFMQLSIIEGSIAAPVPAMPILAAPVPAAPTLVAPFLAAPIPVTPIPATPIPAAPTLAAPFLAAPIPATPIPAAPNLAQPIPAAPTPAAPTPAAPTPAVPIPAAPIPATRIPATRIPATRIPATRIPGAPIPATRIPAAPTLPAPIPAAPVPVPIPVACSEHAIAIRVREPSLAQSAAQDEVVFDDIGGQPSKPKPRPQPRKKPPIKQPLVNEGNKEKPAAATLGDEILPKNTNPPTKRSTGMAHSTEDPSANHMQKLLEGLFVDELKNWIQEYGITPAKS